MKHLSWVGVTSLNPPLVCASPIQALTFQNRTRQSVTLGEALMEALLDSPKETMIPSTDLYQCFFFPQQPKPT